MKKLISIILFIFFVSTLIGQEIEHYNLTVPCDVLNKKIRVERTIEKGSFKIFKK